MAKENKGKTEEEQKAAEEQKQKAIYKQVNKIVELGNLDYALCELSGMANLLRQHDVILENEDLGGWPRESFFVAMGVGIEAKIKEIRMLFGMAACGE